MLVFACSGVARAPCDFADPLWWLAKESFKKTICRAEAAVFRSVASSCEIVPKNFYSPAIFVSLRFEFRSREFSVIEAISLFIQGGCDFFQFLDSLVFSIKRCRFEIFFKAAFVFCNRYKFHFVYLFFFVRLHNVHKLLINIKRLDKDFSYFLLTSQKKCVKSYILYGFVRIFRIKTPFFSFFDNFLPKFCKFGLKKSRLLHFWGVIGAHKPFVFFNGPVEIEFFQICPFAFKP